MNWHKYDPLAGKLAPLTVITVPPTSGPLLGELLLTAGRARQLGPNSPVAHTRHVAPVRLGGQMHAPLVELHRPELQFGQLWQAG